MMEFILPEWAPNIHPMVVHFPIALLFFAVLADILALIYRAHTVLVRLSTILFVSGAVVLFMVWLSGRAAADSVMVSGVASAVLTDHADSATLTLWYFGAYGLLRLVLWRLRFALAMWIPLAILGVGGLLLIYQSSNLGARLVFEQGVGVARVDALSSELAAVERELAHLKGQGSAPVVEPDGSWSWTPDQFAKEAFEQSFEIWEGELNVSARQDSSLGTYRLALSTKESSAFVVLNSPIKSVEFDVDLDLSDFNGAVRVVHHAIDRARYDYAELADGYLRLGRFSDEGQEVFDEQPFIPSAPTKLRVTCDLTHFRAYADGGMIAHAHGSAAEAGPVGIMINGSGTLLLGSMHAKSLR